MRSKLALFILAFAGCYKSTGPEICEPVVTSWASPAWRCLAYVKETPPPPPAPAPEPPPPPPAPKTEITQEQIKLKEKVEFETDSAVLKDKSKGLLDEVVQVMKDHPEIEHVRVAGHTDSEGARGHNQKLSEERAASVKQYLVDHGVAADRLASKGYGQDRPIADNKTEDGRAENRRVEIHILRRKGEMKDREPDDKK
ncbi:MAG TPA: OmpA family protein [Kofleriaceae bacterium]|jgi:outer membrane protein OmpA-like peptidoglycan-associated protein|nr:OmpA family protein [Kofleriaceae bacterium]